MSISLEAAAAVGMREERRGKERKGREGKGTGAAAAISLLLLPLNPRDSTPLHITIAYKAARLGNAAKVHLREGARGVVHVRWNLNRFK